MDKRHVNIGTVKVMSVGILPKTGGKYALVLQSEKNIDAILSLQDTVYGDLSPQEKSYLLPKERTFFEDHFAEGGAVLGVVHAGRLIAQSVIVNPADQSKKSVMTDFNAAIRPEEMTVIQGVGVDPAFRGNGLLSVMVGAWSTMALKAGRRHAVAEVDARNHHSWSVFMKEGMRLHSPGVDQSDGTALYNLHAPAKQLLKRVLSEEFRKAASRKGVRVPIADIEAQKALMREGYKGIALDFAAREVVFRRPGPGGKRLAA